MKGYSMGLFDRLFGQKKEDEPLKEELGKAQEESEALSNDVAITGLEDVDEPSNILLDREQEISESDDNDVLSSSNIDNNKVEIENESSESHSDFIEMQRQQNSIEELTNRKAQEEFMAKYYAQKAQLQDKIDNGTYVKDEEVTSQNDIVEISHQEVQDNSETNEEKYHRSLKKTRTGFAARLNAFLANFRRVDEDFFEELEELLILSDVGVNVATQLTEDLRYEAKLENVKKSEDLKRLIIEKLVNIYEKDGVYNEKINYQDGLTVMLFVGVNGVGKTTSIGKLAYRLKNEGKKVLLVAADTFRAGAVAQLVEWGKRVDVPVVTGPENADPASVVFDGMERAVSENVDVLLIDTAGRLQNKQNLMLELEKIGRIIKRVLPEAPHETLLALDASTGQNALSQAKEFSKITPLTGLILTKIDGTAKGGVVLAIRQELDIPVKFIGFGEKIDDIGTFDSEDFMKGLLEGIV